MRTQIDAGAVQEMRRRAAARLLERRTAAGHWVGRLSSSAPATAAAITALRLVDERKYAGLIRRGEAWLLKTQNADGGWGDTPVSRSNISTTVLCWAALPEDCGAAAELARRWITDHAGDASEKAMVDAVVRRCGDDRALSAPILAMAALRGRAEWDAVMPLPFVRAACPQAWFRWMRSPAGLHALPALIALGKMRHHHRPASNAAARLVRAVLGWPTLRVLTRMQPTSGGFLEAVPLTGFVTMSLAGMGLGEHPVARRGAEFLERSIREDGSWAIGTNLATRLTAMAVTALASGGELSRHMGPGERGAVARWLLDQQHRRRHPCTGAAPGGWSWTDGPGGAPDAEDTAGALVALAHLRDAEGAEAEANAAWRYAAERGVRWLLGLQNRDGGLPTFCRGSGRQAVDRSCPGITAHAVRAWRAWGPRIDGRLAKRADVARLSAYFYLEESRSEDGSWSPLWFGHEHAEDGTNPVYGTSRVMLADHSSEAAIWLVDNQQSDGGWGGRRGGGVSNVEETALAIAGLAEILTKGCVECGAPPDRPITEAEVREAVRRGTAWLMERTDGGRVFEAAPIGLCFARRGYAEELYPLAMTVEAMERIALL